MYKHIGHYYFRLFSCSLHPEFVSSKALSTLSQKSATVAEFGDSRTFCDSVDRR